MKQNKLTIILIVIIILLVGFIIYERIPQKEEIELDENTEEIKLVSQINLDYLDIYLTSDGLAYLVPLKKEEINELNVGKNLKDRLNILYDKGFFLDVYVDNYQIKGFKVSLDDKITKMNKIELYDNSYIVFLKENHTLGMFDYQKYLDDLNTLVVDNYNDYKNISDIKENDVIYLDGAKEKIKID